MAYTGAATPGGAAQFRRLSQLTIGKISVGAKDNNAYLLRCNRTGQALLIDAAAEPQRLIEFMTVIPDTSVVAILTTHRHADHWGALVELVGHTRARTIAHPADATELPVVTDELVSDSDLVKIGDIELSIIHLLGHTPGSISVLYQDPAGSPHLFTGDSLFPGGVGNTWGNAADFASLIRDVETKIFAKLPDQTWVYPGHGNDTTLGAERPHLGEWQARRW